MSDSVVAVPVARIGMMELNEGTTGRLIKRTHIGFGLGAAVGVLGAAIAVGSSDCTWGGCGVAILVSGIAVGGAIGAVQGVRLYFRWTPVDLARESGAHQFGLSFTVP